MSISKWLLIAAVFSPVLSPLVALAQPENGGELCRSLPPLPPPTGDGSGMTAGFAPVPSLQNPGLELVRGTTVETDLAGAFPNASIAGQPIAHFDPITLRFVQVGPAVILSEEPRIIAMPLSFSFQWGRVMFLGVRPNGTVAARGWLILRSGKFSDQTVKATVCTVRDSQSIESSARNLAGVTDAFVSEAASRMLDHAFATRPRLLPETVAASASAGPESTRPLIKR